MQTKKGSGSSGSAGKKTGGKSDSTKSGKDSGSDRGKQKKKGRFDIAKVRCYNCNEKGHFQSDCPEPKCEKANLVQKEEEDPTLFMLETCELQQ